MELEKRTKGLDPKVPAQALAAIIVFVLAKFGLDLDADVSAAIATLIGFIAGVAAPAATTFTRRKERKP